MELEKSKYTGKEWILILYVAGQSVKSVAAEKCLKDICEEILPGRYELKIIDLLFFPQFARQDQILAIPTLVRKLPLPEKKIFGDLANVDSVLRGLDLKPNTTHI